MPIETPMMPAPAVVTNESDAEANSEEERWAFIPNARIGIPTRPRDNRVAVHNPGIVRRNVDDFGADRLDLNVGAFRTYGLLCSGVKVASFLRTAAQHLNSVHDALFLVVVGVAKGRGPREVLVHVPKDRRKCNECFHALVPRHPV